MGEVQREWAVNSSQHAGLRHARAHAIDRPHPARPAPHTPRRPCANTHTHSSHTHAHTYLVSDDGLGAPQQQPLELPPQPALGDATLGWGARGGGRGVARRGGECAASTTGRPACPPTRPSSPPPRNAQPQAMAPCPPTRTRTSATSSGLASALCPRFIGRSTCAHGTSTTALSGVHTD